MAASEDEVEFAEFVPAQLPRFTGS